MLEAMMMGSPVRMFDTETGEPAEIDPSKVCATPTLHVSPDSNFAAIFSFCNHSQLLSV